MTLTKGIGMRKKGKLKKKIYGNISNRFCLRWLEENCGNDSEIRKVIEDIKLFRCPTIHLWDLSGMLEYLQQSESPEEYDEYLLKAYLKWKKTK